MTAQPDDLFHSKRGVAALVACLVQTIGETDPTFQDRFLKRLTAAYYELRDNNHWNEAQSLELLSWTRENLTGFDFVNGQGKPFLADYDPNGG